MIYPASTYRLQLHAGFTFRDATAVVPYLHALGVTHLYTSPILAAKAGSTHGYDVIDHCRLNPELGTDADFDALAHALRERGMGLIVDIVPNHVGVATNDNTWWNDVLRHGQASNYAKHFDIDWNSSNRPELHGKVLLPVLGKSYGDTLDAKDLKLSRDDAGVWVYYFDRRFPIAPTTIDASSNLEALNNDRDALHALLEQQHYRLASWKTAADEINYRRFFDINDLAALAMERAEVFDETHALTLKLMREGKIAGLRLDHPDGLYDPAAYFERLKNATGDDAYILAEKILAMDEALPRDWAVDGTTGYDFLAQVNALFVDALSEPAMTALYSEFTGDETPFDERVYTNKKLILENALASELHVLAHRFDRLGQKDAHWRDFTVNSIRSALAEVIACFAVYRTYIASTAITDIDRQHIKTAIERAQARRPRLDAAVFQFIEDVLLQKVPAHFNDDARAQQLKLAGKFQQLTAPTTAKGIEDTTFYQYHRLISLNEVGGEPSHFGVSPEALHDYFADRQKHWPNSMSTLSTHDTKRSEDVRARINVLSQMPDDWRERVLHWHEMNAEFDPPHPADEYLLYQTLVGALPFDATAKKVPPTFIERIQAFMTKALREGKQRTTWTQPDEAYEARVTTFAEAVLKSRAFLADLHEFTQPVARAGMIASLSQTLIKLTAPGVPDTYQGTELWDVSLVDPDNRRPVDYEHRRWLLNELSTVDASSLKKTLEDGRAKLLVTTKALIARRDLPDLFARGEYRALTCSGDGAESVFAFARSHGSARALIIVPRFTTANASQTLSKTQIELPDDFANSHWANAFTGSELDVNSASVNAGKLLAEFPVALLISRG